MHKTRFWLIFIDIIIMIVFILYYLYWRYSSALKAAEIEKENITIGDYAVLVTNLPEKNL